MEPRHTIAAAQEQSPSVARESRLEYQAPELFLIGNAADVILGLPGGGADGPYGMTDPSFEFEPDGM